MDRVILAGRLLKQDGQLVPDQRKGTINISSLEDGILMLDYQSEYASDINLELALASGDASFHHIKMKDDSQVVGLKLQSSGDKYFFWLQNPADQADKLVNELNNALTVGSAAETKDASTPPAPKMAKFASSLASTLAGIFGGIKPSPTTSLKASQLLSTDAIMDACDPADIQDHLHQYFPEGYQPTKQDLRSLVTSPYFGQAVDALDQIMASEDAPTFLAQFGLLQYYDGQEQLGVSGLLKAIHNKYKK